MYISFIEYFNEDDYNEDDIRRIINEHFEHHANSEFSTDLYSLLRLKFDVMPCSDGDDDETVTIWLKQSGRDTMRQTMDDLMTVLDARDCIDWSKIPDDCGGTLHG